MKKEIQFNKGSIGLKELILITIPAFRARFFTFNPLRPHLHSVKWELREIVIRKYKNYDKLQFK